MKHLESHTNSESDRETILNGTVQVWQILHLLRGDCFLSLREASKICCLSKNTLLTSHNLAKYQPGGRGGKILIKKSELFHWIENTRVLELDLDAICKNALDGLRMKKASSK